MTIPLAPIAEDLAANPDLLNPACRREVPIRHCSRWLALPGLLPAPRWALPHQPLPAHAWHGGLFSVALSLVAPPGVTWHRASWSPTFSTIARRGHPAIRAEALIRPHWDRVKRPEVGQRSGTLPSGVLRPAARSGAARPRIQSRSASTRTRPVPQRGQFVSTCGGTVWKSRAQHHAVGLKPLQGLVPASAR